MTSLDGINGQSIQTLLRGENDSKQSDEFQAKSKVIKSLRVTRQNVVPYFTPDPSTRTLILFARREGVPGARVTLARGLPMQWHISSFSFIRVLIRHAGLPLHKGNPT